MVEIRYVQSNDKEFWFSLDSHLQEQEFYNKISNKRGYVLFDDNKPIGLLRYNLFGIIHHFVQCYLLIGIIKKGLRKETLETLGK